MAQPHQALDSPVFGFGKAAAVEAAGLRFLPRFQFGPEGAAVLFKGERLEGVLIGFDSRERPIDRIPGETLFHHLLDNPAAAVAAGFAEVLGVPGGIGVLPDKPQGLHLAGNLPGRFKTHTAGKLAGQLVSGMFPLFQEVKGPFPALTVVGGLADLLKEGFVHFHPLAEMEVGNQHI